MLNYALLNDVEFEYLCQDIMQKKLGIALRRFAAGRDGGIDLVDDVVKKNIIVQVKHYQKSTFSTLLRSLKKEVGNVKKQNPKQYYVCCSTELTPQNVAEIYSLFADYMESDRNVVTLLEIDDFLTAPENKDIFDKHYKLWLPSIDILSEIFNNDIFIDCQALLSGIENDKKIFVQTNAYDRALDLLSQDKALLIIGEPGVGKTITSKMLVWHYASQGYRARYTTDGADIKELKESLHRSKKMKEVVLLDDCFGQAYFNMKETQGNELLALIQYVNMSENKILILNSRVTIYREAEARAPELIKSIENKKYRLHRIDMSAISDVEKTKIFYNHLYFNNIKPEYFQAIKSNKNYRKIVLHKNYNPRIIEFVSNPNRYANISPSDYYSFVMKHLDNPEKVWEDEYERRLKNVDRIFLTTLFSLSDTSIERVLLQKCFNYRLSKMSDVDDTIDNFKNSLARLQESFVNIVDDRGIEKLSMVNPSVNDYINLRIESNSLEKDRLVGSIIMVRQCKKLLSAECADEKIRNAFLDGSILDYFFESEEQRRSFIAYYVSSNKITDARYTWLVHSYLRNICDVNTYEKRKIYANQVFNGLFEESVNSFYKISELLSDFELLKTILRGFDLEDLVGAISLCYKHYENDPRFTDICCGIIRDAIEAHCCDVDAKNFDLNFGSIVSECQEVDYEFDGHHYTAPDFDEASEIVKETVKETVKEEVISFIKRLPEEMTDFFYNFIDKVHINVGGADKVMTSYLDDRADYDDERYYRRTSGNLDEVDSIFER